MYFSRNKIASHILTIFVACMLLLTTIYTGFAYASGSVDSVRVDDMRKGSIMTIGNASGYSEDNGSGSPDSTIFDEKSKTNGKFGFDALYGVGSRYTKYTGEVPNAASDEIKADHPVGTAEIGKNKREWSNNPGTVVDGADWSGDSVTDLHANNLTKSLMPFDQLVQSINNIASGIIFWASGIFISLLSFEVTIANIDLNSIINTAGGFTGLNNIISNTFLGAENGQVSPLLVIAVAIFIVSLVVAIFKFATQGTGTIVSLMGEFGMFMLAMFIALLAMSGGLAAVQTTLFNTSSMFVENLIANPNGETTSALYQHKTAADDDAAGQRQDSIDTLISMTKQPMIETVIRNQFGYNVDELFINKDNFGDVDYSDIITNLTDSSETSAVDLFKINLGGDNFWPATGGAKASNLDGETSVTSYGNLGYYWYASLSELDLDNPVTIDSNGKVTRNLSSDSNKYLYVMDFLSSVASKENGNTEKCVQIMNNFFNPSTSTIEALVLALVLFLEVIAIGMSVGFTLLGSVIFNLGMIIVPILPILLIIPKTRELAKKLVVTWFVSLLRMVVGLAFITLTIQLTATFCKQGLAGMGVAMIFLVIIFLAGPRIFIALNNMCGSHEIGPMRDVTRKFNDFCQFTSNHRNPLANAAKYAQRRADMAKQMKEHQTQQDKIEDESKAEFHKIMQDGFSNVDKKDNKQNNNGSNGSSSLESDENDEDTIEFSPYMLNEQDEKMINEASSLYVAENQRIESVPTSQRLIDAGADKDSEIVQLQLKKEELLKKQEELKAKELNRTKRRYDFEGNAIVRALSHTNTGAAAISAVEAIQDKNPINKFRNIKAQHLQAKIDETEASYKRKASGNEFVQKAEQNKKLEKMKNEASAQQVIEERRKAATEREKLKIKRRNEDGHQNGKYNNMQNELKKEHLEKTTSTEEHKGKSIKVNLPQNNVNVKSNDNDSSKYFTDKRSDMKQDFLNNTSGGNSQDSGNKNNGGDGTPPPKTK